MFDGGRNEVNFQLSIRFAAKLLQNVAFLFFGNKSQIVLKPLVNVFFVRIVKECQLAQVILPRFGNRGKLL